MPQIDPSNSSASVKRWIISQADASSVMTADPGREETLARKNGACSAEGKAGVQVVARYTRHCSAAGRNFDLGF
jgi:hypothetical protein